MNNDKLLIGKLLYVLAAIAVSGFVLLALYGGSGWFAGAGLLALAFVIIPGLWSQGDEYSEKGKDELRMTEYKSKSKP
jgi:hypothetical protein